MSTPSALTSHRTRELICNAQCFNIELSPCSCIPSSYIYSLECFISVKQDQLRNGGSPADPHLSAWYNYQSKYVGALIKQLPAGTVFASTQTVSVHPPKTISNPVARQGPFLLQPVPRTLEGSDGGDATDITYLSFGNDEEEEDGRETDHLGVIVVAYQDGKVDLFLDVEKVEAKWTTKYVSLFEKFPEYISDTL